MRFETADMGRPIKPHLPDYMDHTTGAGVAEIVWFNDHKPSHDRDFTTGILYCKLFPQANVSILTNALSLQHGTLALLAQGAAYQIFLRGQELPFEMDCVFSEKVRWIIQSFRDGVLGDEEGQVPTNFRVYPIFEAHEELEYSYLRKKKRFEDWVAQIREWSEHGI
jgi:hypothetical protein